MLSLLVWLSVDQFPSIFPCTLRWYDTATTSECLSPTHHRHTTVLMASLTFHFTFCALWSVIFSLLSPQNVTSRYVARFFVLFHCCQEWWLNSAKKNCLFHHNVNAGMNRIGWKRPSLPFFCSTLSLSLSLLLCFVLFGYIVRSFRFGFDLVYAWVVCNLSVWFVNS